MALTAQHVQSIVRSAAKILEACPADESVVLECLSAVTECGGT